MFGLLPAVDPPRRLLLPLLAILGLTAWMLLSLTWTESAERTFAEVARMVGYLGVVILVSLGIGRSTWRLAAAGLLGAGVLVCCLIVLSRIWPALFPSDTVALNLKATRANYPFGYWNAVGCWCAMTTTLCLAWAAHARSTFVRCLALAAVPVAAVGLYLALSRAGFGGAAIGAIVLVALAENRWLTFLQALCAAAGSLFAILVVHQHPQIVVGSGNAGAGAVVAALLISGALLAAVAATAAQLELGRRMRMDPAIGRPLGFAVAALAVVAVIAAAAMFGGRAYDEFTGRTEVVVAKNADARLAQLNGNRHNLWSSAWRAFTAHPLLGIGPGTFEFWWSRDGVNGEFVRDVHNIYLEALAETGVMGLVLLAAFFLALLACALAARRELIARHSSGVGIQAGLIAVFVVFAAQAAVDWMWESTAVAIFALFAVLLACAASSPRRVGGGGASVPIGLLVASTVAILVMLVGMANQRQIEKSQAAFRAQDYGAALSHAADAIRAERWSATAFGQRALALEALGRYDAAIGALKIAEAKEPTNWRWPLIGVKLYVAAGDPDAAAEQLRKARELRRYQPLIGLPRPTIR